MPRLLLLLMPVLLLTGCFEDPKDVRQRRADVKQVLGQYIGMVQALDSGAANYVIHDKQAQVRDAINNAHSIIKGAKNAMQPAIYYVNEQYMLRMKNVIKDVDFADDGSAIVRVSIARHPISAVRSEARAAIAPLQAAYDGGTIMFDAMQRDSIAAINAAFDATEMNTDMVEYRVVRQTDAWKVVPDTLLLVLDDVMPAADEDE